VLLALPVVVAALTEADDVEETIDAVGLEGSCPTPTGTIGKRESSEASGLAARFCSDGVRLTIRCLAAMLRFECASALTWAAKRTNEVRSERKDSLKKRVFRASMAATGIKMRGARVVLSPLAAQAARVMPLPELQADGNLDTHAAVVHESQVETSNGVWAVGLVQLFPMQQSQAQTLAAWA